MRREHAVRRGTFGVRLSTAFIRGPLGFFWGARGGDSCAVGAVDAVGLLAHLDQPLTHPPTN